MFAERVERTIFRDLQPRRVRYVRPVPRDKAEGLVARVYDQMEADYALVPPVTLHSCVPELMAAVWAIVRESLVAGPVSRARREAVAAAVSGANRCPFCVDAHAIMLTGAKQGSVARALRAGRDGRVGDAATDALVRWARATHSPDPEFLRPPPFSAEEAPAYVGTALVFHYINRIVNVFLKDSPFALPPGFHWLKGTMVRVGGALFGGRIVSRPVEPSTSVGLSEIAKGGVGGPDDNGPIARAFALFIAAIDKSAAAIVPPRVDDLVQKCVEEWRGEDPGMDGRWLEDALRGLDGAERASARLSLLTALASYRVDEGTVGDFRRQFPGDEHLVVTVARASFLAARRTASWIGNAPWPTSRGFLATFAGPSLPGTP